METDKLVNRLLELPKKLASVQIDILDSTQETQNISNEIMKCEMKLKQIVSSATDDNGKKLHTNEEARRAAFIEMAEDDLELADLKQKSVKADKKLQDARINFDILSNEQKNIRTVLIFLAGRSEA